MPVQKILVLAFLFSFGIQPLFSQTLKWGPPLDISDNFHQTPVGKIEGSYYLLSGNAPYHEKAYSQSSSNNSIRIGKNKLKVIKFNESLSSFEETYFDFRKEMDELIAAYILDNQIHILYITNDEILKKRVLDKNLKEVSANEYSIKTWKKSKPYYDQEPNYYVFALDSDKKRFALCIYESVGIFDTNLSPLSILKQPNQIEVVSAVLNQDHLYFVGLEGKNRQEVTKATAYHYTLSSKELKKDVIEDNIALSWGQTLFLDKSSGKLHYFSFSADKSYLNRKGIRERDLANSLNHKVYSASLVREETQNLSLSHYKDAKGKVLGIDDPFIRDIFITDGINVLINPHWRQIGQSGNGHVYNDNYLFKIKDGKLGKEKTIEKLSSGVDSWYYLYPTIIIHGKNSHMLLFQNGTLRYTLKKVVVDNDFNIISDEKIDVYKDHDYYLALDEYLQVDSKTALIWGRYKSNTGSVMVTME